MEQSCASQQASPVRCVLIGARTTDFMDIKNGACMSGAATHPARRPTVDLSEAIVTQLLVPVDDLDRAVRFYRDTLGLPFLFTAPPQMAFFQVGSVRLLVGVLPAGQAAQRGSQIYFQVADIHAVFETLTGRGVAFQAPPHVIHRTAEYELWLAEFRDPDGNQLALMGQAPLARPVN